MKYRDMPLRRRLKIKTRTRHRQRFWSYHDQESYECPSCGRGYETVGQRWDVHHKDGDALNGHIFNLVALCYRCHKHTHAITRIKAQLDDWKDRFLALGSHEGENIARPDLSVTGQTTLDDFRREEVVA